MPPRSECLRAIGSVQGQGKLRESNPCTKQCRFELSQHADEPSGFRRMLPTLFGAKQPMQRPCDVLDGAHHTKEVLTPNDCMIATTVPAPRTAQKIATSIHDTVING